MYPAGYFTGLGSEPGVEGVARPLGFALNRFPGGITGYYIELEGRRDRGPGANGVARQNMLVSRGRLLIPRIIPEISARYILFARSL